MFLSMKLPKNEFLFKSKIEFKKNIKLRMFNTQ